MKQNISFTNILEDEIHKPQVTPSKTENSNRVPDLESLEMIKNDFRDVLIIPYSVFERLNNPLDTIENIYLPFTKISDYYAKNDLKTLPPYFNYNKNLEKVAYSKKSICLVRTVYYICLLKLLLSPFTFFLDFLVTINVRRIAVDTTIAYSCGIAFLFLLRLMIWFFIWVGIDNKPLKFLSIWLLAGGLIDITQIIFLCKLRQVIHKLTEEEIKILKQESFNQSCL